MKTKINVFIVKTDMEHYVWHHLLPFIKSDWNDTHS